MRSQTIGHRDDGPSGLRRESLRLTLADMLGVVFGFAVCLAMPFAFRFGPIGLIGAQLPLWFVALLGTLWIMQGLAFAISAVVVARIAQFHRQPRSAEWLAMLVSVWFLSVTLPPPDEFITQDFTMWRWSIGGLALVVSVVVMLLAVRKTLATAIRTLLVCFAALTLMWGPYAVLQLEFADLFPWLDRLGDGWTFWLVLSALRFVAALPLAMLFGIPVVATIHFGCLSCTFLWISRLLDCIQFFGSSAHFLRAVCTNMLTIERFRHSDGESTSFATDR